MPDTQQIIWGGDKLFIVTHLADWKIKQALEDVLEFMGTYEHCFNPYRQTHTGHLECIMNKAVVDIRRKKFKRLRKSLEILSDNGYILSYTLISSKPLKIIWMNDFVALDDGAPVNRKAGETILEEPQPPRKRTIRRTMGEVRKENRNDTMWPELKRGEDGDIMYNNDLYHHQMESHENW